MTFIPDVVGALTASQDNGSTGNSQVESGQIITHTLKAEGHDASEDGTGRGVPLTVALRGREGGATAELGGDQATALRASKGGGDKPHVLAAMAIGISNQPTPKFGIDVAPSLDSKEAGGGRMEAVAVGMAVRRLLPTECEALQGFPRGWTDNLSDSGRYRCLGNAVAVPVAAWIGRRIVAVEGKA